MTESYGFEFKVDATGAAKGWQQFQSAVEGVFGALDKMEAHVGKTMAAVNSGTRTSANGIKELANAAKALSSVSVSSSSAKNIGALGAAMVGFKAPTAAQIGNLKDFFKVLGNSGVGGGATAARNIMSMNAAMAGFKAPNASQIANLNAFFNTLDRFKSNSALSRLGPLLASLGPLANFRAPSAAQVRNLESFITAIDHLKVPANAGQIASSLNQISAAAGNASSSLRGVRGNLMGGGGGGGFGWREFTAGTHGARLEMMGLQNAFSGTFQVGSLLRSLLGSLTIGELGRSFFEATQTANQFSASMEAISEAPGFREENWKKVQAAADHFGTDISKYSESFSKFALAAHEAGTSVNETFKIYEGFQNVMTAMHLGTEQQQSVGLAMREMMDKGFVASQQITKQLGMVLPGALVTLTKAWKEAGHSHDNFIEAMRKKEVSSIWALDVLANHYKDTYGKAVAQALESPIQQFAILHNRIKEMEMQISEGGSKKAFADLLRMTSEWLSPVRVKHFAQIISNDLTNAVHKVQGFVKMIHDHWDSIKGPLSTVLTMTGRMMLISAGFKFTQFLVTPIIRAHQMMKLLLPMLREAEVLSAMGGVAGTLGKLNTPLRSISLLMAEAFSPIGLMRFGSAIEGMISKIKGFGPAIIEGLTTPIEGGIAAMAGVIVAGITGAFAAAVSGAHDQGMKLESDQYTTTEIIKGFFLLACDQIAGAWKTVTEWMDAKAKWLGSVLHLPFKTALGAVATFFEWLAYKATGAFDLILDAAITVADAIAKQFKSIGNMVGDAVKGDWAGMATEAGNIFGGNFVKSVQQHMGQSHLGAPDFATYQKNAGLGASALLSAAGARGRGTPDKADGTWYSNGSTWYDSDPYSPTTGDTNIDPRYHGIDGSGGGKGRHHKAKKGKDPFDELKQLQAQADQVMADLAGKDPVWKLTDTYVKHLTQEAQILLGKEGYGKWLDTMKKANGDTTVGFNALIDNMGKTARGHQVLTDMAARYGMTVEKLTARIKQENSAYEFQKKQLQEVAGFGAKLLQDKDNEIKLTMLSATQNKVLSEVMAEVIRYRGTEGELNQKQIDQLTKLLTIRERNLDIMKQEQEFYKNNGVNNYIKDTKTAGEAVHELDNNFLKSLDDTLFNIGKTGKLSFTSLINTVQDSLLHFASQNITKSLTGFLTGASGGTNNPTIFGDGGKLGFFGKLFGMSTGFDKETAGKRFDAQNVDLHAASVNIDGKLMMGGSGGLLGGAGGLLGGGSGGPLDLGGGGIGTNIFGGTNADGTIKIADTFKDQMDATMAQVSNQAGMDMTKSLGSSIHGLGGLLSSVFHSAAGGGGGGGLLGIAGSLIGGIFGGGGGLGIAKNFSASAGLQASVKSNILANPGLFMEGGFSNSPVSRFMGVASFANAPHYAEGTANTNGGHPAILHDNEAVIPLSRGRKVPVELTNGSGGGSQTNVHNTWNIQTPNADSFKKSQQQITTQMHGAANRATRRNH